MTEPVLTMVYLEAGMLLSKRPFSDWRDAQACYPDYKSSLSWETPDAATGFLTDEYPDFEAETGQSWRQVVAALLAGDDDDVVVSQNEKWAPLVATWRTDLAAEGAD